MAKLLKLRRGTTSQHSSFTGAEGEVTVDTTKDTLVVHDGSTAGGHELLREDMSNLPAGTIDNADINSSAAIAGSKIAPVFSAEVHCNAGLDTDGDVKLNSGTTNANILFDASEQSLEFDDNVKATFGFGKDLQIFHNGTNSLIENLTGPINIRTASSKNAIVARQDAAVELYHNNSKKLETTASGITVTGTITGADNHGLLLGDSQDFRIRHTGSHSEITDEGTGNLRLGSNQTEIRTANLATLSAKFVGAGAVELNHNGSKKFETASTGVTVTGNIGVSGTVDGRDIASDGSKLDGIATGATNVSTENIQDIVGAMVSSNTESGITVSYQDGDGTLDFSVGSLSNSQIASNAAISLSKLETITSNRIVGNDSGNAVPKELTAAEVRSIINVADGANNITNNNQLTNGAGYITSASFSDVAGGGTFTGDVTVDGGAGALTVDAHSDISFTNGNWTGNHTKIQHHSSYLYIVGGSNGIIFREGGNDRAQFDTSGHFVPSSSNVYNLGATNLRWANVYTNDLHLSNEGSSNDVDSTWGDWTIQEGESDLFLKNNRSGKKYKFNLTEVS